ncbi:MAG: arginine--tRNA ligase [Bacteroidales bacterium]|jgi:arginyl-tRNA synthetase|nr:arginine--tRNA ligase [Bacteroidales bacterium]
MMIEEKIIIALQQTLKELYAVEIACDKSILQKTRKEFEGDFTIVIFQYAKPAKKSPEIVAQEIGDQLLEKISEIKSYNIVKGFLNLLLHDHYWLHFFTQEKNNIHFGITSKKESSPFLIEFSSPNTNKPLHLGHIRNNVLGSSIAAIEEACGKRVIKVNLVNDRGIHICKSMLAWQRFGNGETPETSGLKGDHLVGKYYVLFDQHYKADIKNLIASGMTEEEAAKKAPIMLDVQEMLRKWEQNDEAVRALWVMMNRWVYDGFEETYQRMGISFDKIYHESEVYLFGKQLVEKGLKAGVFYQKKDHSIWADLTDEGMDEKLLLRGDGTSVYITQDMGTAEARYQEFLPEKMVYVVGNEQIYHFNVLKFILEYKLKLEAGKAIFHLSYGMVELPSGKMKSREGTVVDADDLMEEMFVQAKQSTEQLGKTDFEGEEAKKLNEMIGLGALKYFILKVDPKKNMMFNPEESIDLNGNTAPFIQYTHARIRSLLRKADAEQIDLSVSVSDSFIPEQNEKELIKMLYDYPQTVLNAGENYSPALIANYIFDLAKEFNRFYQESPIMKETELQKKNFRLQLSQFVATVIKNAMQLLGIGVPERM